MVALNASAHYAVRFLYPAPLHIGERVAFDFGAIDADADFFASCAVMEYTARVTPLGGATTERSGALNGAGDIVAFLCPIGGGGSGTYKAHVNSILVPEAGPTASALTAALALALARRRRA